MIIYHSMDSFLFTSFVNNNRNYTYINNNRNYIDKTYFINYTKCIKYGNTLSIDVICTYLNNYISYSKKHTNLYERSYI